MSRLWVGLVLCAMLTAPAVANVAPRQDAGARVVLTEGLVGGVVAPIQTVYVLRQEGSTVRVWRKVPEARTQSGIMTVAELSPQAYQEFVAWMTASGFLALPREVPSNCEDIYGLNTSIHIVTTGANWVNGGPSGCVHGQSMVHANADQKALFAEARQRLVALVEGLNYAPADPKEGWAIINER